VVRRRRKGMIGYLGTAGEGDEKNGDGEKLNLAKKAPV
jgi:hypothetical protein